MGGCLLNDNTTWSQQMLAYSSRPPDPAIVGESWRAQWLERLEQMPLLAADWLRHQRRDAFWEHGSVCQDYGAIKAAVLAVGGWYDSYSNAVPRLLAGMTAPCQGIIGPWEHRYPHLAKVTPNMDFLAEAVRWWDHWLKGIDNGVADQPALRAFLIEAAPASAGNGPRDGRWVAEPVWPSPAIERHRLYLNRDGLDSAPGDQLPLEIASPQHVGLACGNFCPGMRIDDELPDDQRPDDALSALFDSAPLEAPLDILGAPVVELELSADRPLALVAARLCDVAPDGASTRVSHNPLNLAHRDSHAFPEPLVPGESTRLRFKLCDAGYSFRAGHRIRLALSTSYWPLVWPSPEPVTLTLRTGASTLSLPVRPRGADPTSPDPAPANPAPGQETTRPAANSRVVRSESDGRIAIEIEDDLGESRDRENGLVTGSTARHSYWIAPDDPLSAETEAAWSFTLGRDNWHVRTETWTRMTADETHFHLTARLEAYEGGELLFEKDWQESIPRDLV
jgi:predicted acyl esterase